MCLSMWALVMGDDVSVVRRGVQDDGEVCIFWLAGSWMS